VSQFNHGNHRRFIPQVTNLNSGLSTNLVLGLNDEKSVTAGTKPRSRLSKLKTKFHTKRAVIRTVPISCQQRRIFECHGRSMNVSSDSRNSGCRLGAVRESEKATGN
jgi:hypothetical protein